ncbi:MAG: flagellar basal body L-ring protein FlgH [Phycisphaerae bacterium]
MKIRSLLGLTLILGMGANLGLGQDAAAPLTATVPPPVADVPGAPPPAPGGPLICPPVRGSLFKLAAQSMPTPLVTDPAHPPSAVASVSLIAVPPAQARKIKKHDLVQIVIAENSSASSSGASDSKKTQSFDAALQQFLALGRFSGGLQQLGNVANPSKLPEIKFNYNNDAKANADSSRKDQFTGRIQAEVMDVKPNGTLVVEATKLIRTDKEQQVFRLTGVCRAEDVAADNSVLSNQLADLKLAKDTKGSVSEGIKRGWLNRAIDAVSPF